MIEDEELAEEYIKKNNLEWELECNRTSPIGEVKQAFLAGLKASRLKWHDLRKDPNDLPILETELLCQKLSGRCFAGYYKDNKFYSYETGMSAYTVVRWLDIGVWWNIPPIKEAE